MFDTVTNASAWNRFEGLLALHGLHQRPEPLAVVKEFFAFESHLRYVVTKREASPAANNPLLCLHPNCREEFGHRLGFSGRSASRISNRDRLQSESRPEILRQHKISYVTLHRAFPTRSLKVREPISSVS